MKTKQTFAIDLDAGETIDCYGREGTITSVLTEMIDGSAAVVLEMTDKSGEFFEVIIRNSYESFSVISYE